MTSFLVVAFMLAVGGLTAAPAWAQSRLVADANRALVAIGTNGTELGAALARYDLPACGDARQSEVFPVLRGLYLVWTASRDVGLPTAHTVYCQLDVRSGVVSARRAPPGLEVVAADHDRFRVIARAENSIIVLDGPAGPARVIDLSATGVALGLGRTAYAPVAGVVYLVFKGNGTAPLLPVAEPLTVAVIDITTGAVTRRPSAAQRWLHPVQTVTTNTTGTTLLVSPADQAHSTADPFATASVARLSADTGAVAAAAGFAGVFRPGSETIVLDETAGRALLIEDGATIVFDPTTLVEHGRLDAPRRRLPTSSPGNTLDLVFRTDYDVASQTLFVVEDENERQGLYPVVPPNRRNHLLAFDVSSLAFRESVDLAAKYGHAVGAPPLFRILAPPTPRGFRVAVSGRAAAFGWDASPGATQYVLTAGSAPGLADLATLTIAGTSTVVPDVPPGIYHLRVRAVGVSGSSAPTADVVLTVP